jgi:hypothetical protein
VSEQPNHHRATRLASRGVLLETLAVLAFFVGVAVYATWPLAIHPLGGFYGFGNDNLGGIPYFGWLHHAYLGPGNPSLDPELQAPFGLEIPQYAVQPMDSLSSLLFGGFGQGLGAYNAQIFASFVLAGCTMYVLARYVTGSRPAALVAGFAFTSSPFHLSLGMQYNALASIQWVPLYLLALLVLLKRQRRRDAVLTGGAFALIALTSYYYAWFVAWFTLMLLVYVAAAAAVRHRHDALPFWYRARSFGRLVVARGVVAGVVAIVLTAPFLLSSARGAQNAGSQVIEHPINEAVRYSARPWMFFTPPLDNPLVGDRVEFWVQQHLFESPVYEQSIYLGYTLLLLAALAFLPLRKRAPLSERALFARGILAAGLAIGFLITIGPYIPLERHYWRLWPTPGATAHIPSLPWVMFEIAPVFRFFTRAFVLVSVCLALLAAIGFARVERWPRMTPAGRAGLAAVILCLLGFEFANAPPHVWYSAAAPPWVAATAKLPRDSTIVDYPVVPAFSPRSLYYMFWQTKHRKATTNPQVDPEAQALAASFASPDDPASGEALHRAGIDFAVVHTRLPPQTRPPYQPQLPDDSMPADTGAINPWFQLAARTSDAVIYRVLGTPRRVSGTVVRVGPGFGSREREGRVGAYWMQEQTGNLTLFVAGRKRALSLVLTLSSFAQPRDVRVRFDGRLLRSFEVSSGSYLTRTLRLGSPSVGQHVVELEARPAPQSIQKTTGAADSRSVSIRLHDPIVVPVRSH